jgi:hypothetical protein
MILEKSSTAISIWKEMKKKNPKTTNLENCKHNYIGWFICHIFIHQIRNKPKKSMVLFPFNNNKKKMIKIICPRSQIIQKSLHDFLHIPDPLFFYIFHQTYFMLQNHLSSIQLYIPGQDHLILKFQEIDLTDPNLKKVLDGIPLLVYCLNCGTEFLFAYLLVSLIIGFWYCINSPALTLTWSIKKLSYITGSPEVESFLGELYQMLNDVL